MPPIWRMARIQTDDHGQRQVEPRGGAVLAPDHEESQDGVHGGENGQHAGGADQGQRIEDQRVIGKNQSPHARRRHQQQAELSKINEGRLGPPFLPYVLLESGMHQGSDRETGQQASGQAKGVRRLVEMRHPGKEGQVGVHPVHGEDRPKQDEHGQDAPSGKPGTPAARQLIAPQGQDRTEIHAGAACAQRQTAAFQGGTTAGRCGGRQRSRWRRPCPGGLPGWPAADPMSTTPAAIEAAGRPTRVRVPVQGRWSATCVTSPL